MSEKSLISVIVPVYNVEQYLRPCLDSLLGQTYRELEILLIDDGSPDGSGAICDEYAEKDGRIRVFHTENRGVSAARNLGLKEAKGDYIGFVDSDDWIEPEMYELLTRNLEETGSDVSICGIYYENLKLGKKAFSAETVFRDGEILEALMAKKITVHIWNKLYRRKVLDHVSFPEGIVFEDEYFIFDAMDSAETVSLITPQLYHYRKREQSISTTRNAKTLIDYAESRIARYNILKAKHKDLLQKYNDKVLRNLASGFARVWRYWHGCTPEEKKKYKGRISEMKKTVRKIFPLFGFSFLTKALRVSIFFAHSDSRLSFATLYLINNIYRKLHPGKYNSIVNEVITDR